jgi:hypothetical protein
VTHDVPPDLLADIVTSVRPRLAAGARCVPVAAMVVPNGVLIEAVECADGSDEALATVMLSAEISPDGALTGIAMGRVEPSVPTGAAVASTAPDRTIPDGADVFARFCAALGEGPEAAAQCFAASGWFSHASFAPGGPRVLVQGPEAIARALQHRRPGPPTLDLVATAQVGYSMMMHGWGRAPTGRRPFVSSLTFDTDGRLLRYLSVGVSEVTLNR